MGSKPPTVKPRISILTLGVNDLEESMKFYQKGLGLQTEGVVGKEFEHGAVVFFNLKGGLILSLWPRKEIECDAKVPLSSPSATEFTIGHLVNSQQEVDAVMQAEDAGARVVKPAQSTFWGGYAGYFQDPNGGHLWEVVRNPQIHVEE
jgi:catechol 2,3-dioxygenase-like lactoylglutathione lyase family enzyme